MRGVVRTGERLSLSEKLTRLRLRLHDPQWRKYAKTLVAGKLIALGVLFLLIMLMNLLPALLIGSAHGQATMPDTMPATAPAAAATPPAAPDPYALAKGGDIINPLNTVWTLIAAFLVFGMQVGFTMLEAGFCRSRETVNVLVECVFDTCLCGLLYYAFGYAFMFGAGNGFIGWHDPNDAAGTGHELVLPSACECDHPLRRHRRAGAGPLGFPVRVCRLCLDYLLGHDDRSHGVLGRHHLLRLRFGLYLPDHRPLGLGTGWIPGKHGRKARRPTPSRTSCRTSA